MSIDVEASKRRSDSHHKFVEKQISVTVHEKYRKGVYTKESSILKTEREANNPARVTRANVNMFNFKELCIYCESDASESFRAKQKSFIIQAG